MNTWHALRYVQDLRCVMCGQEFHSHQELETHLRRAH